MMGSAFPENTCHLGFVGYIRPEVSGEWGRIFFPTGICVVRNGADFVFPTDEEFGKMFSHKT